MSKQLKKEIRLKGRVIPVGTKIKIVHKYKNNTYYLIEFPELEDEPLMDITMDFIE